jgi:hypothetical protein
MNLGEQLRRGRPFKTRKPGTETGQAPDYAGKPIDRGLDST